MAGDLSQYIGRQAANTATACYVFTAMWHPIETAPKDRCIMGYFGEYVGSGGPSGIEFQTVYWTEKNGGGWLTIGDWRPVRQPSHWMALPEPPVG